MATRPPKRMVRCSTREDRIALPAAHPRPSADELGGDASPLLEEDRRLPGRDEAARPPDHDQHHGEADDQHAVFAASCAQLEDGVEDDDRDDDAELAAEAAEDDDREDDERFESS